jgi:hypothetical protein
MEKERQRRTSQFVSKYQTGQRGKKTMIDILSENSRKEYPKSVTDLLRLEVRLFVQGACYFIKNIPVFILNRYVRKGK